MKCSNELLTLVVIASSAVSACGDAAVPTGVSPAKPADVDASAADGGESQGGAKAKAPEEPDAAAAAPSAPDRGPYYEADPWKGYFWTAKNGADTTLTASKDFSAARFDAQLCVAGSVARTADSSANAMLGVNINQAQRTDAVPLTLVPRRDGVQIELSNAGGSALRVQIAAPEGATNPQKRWCAPITGSGGLIPWSAFNTSCWDDSGNAYQREPISVAMLLVPGNTESALAYDFCLMRLTEGDAPPPGVGAGAEADAGKP